jgi:hypothetical protein
MKKTDAAPPLLGLVLLALSGATQATPFNINLSLGSLLTPTQQTVFANAESFWETVITGYLPGISIASLDIDADGENIDGVGSILGYAGPTLGVNQAGYLLATDGIMRFDTADLANMETNGSLFGVILHEMAHVIGFGTLWTYNGLYVDGTGQYTGANALAAYKLEYDASATFVPVELGGSAGTANGHWNEVDGGSGSTGLVGLLSGEASYGLDMKNELMTGWLNSPTYVSCTTRGALKDLGYDTQACVANITPSSIPEPGNLALLSLGAVAMLIRVGRRRKTAKRT